VCKIKYIASCQCERQEILSGRAGIAQSVFNFGTKWYIDYVRALAVLPPGKEPPYSLKRRLDGPHLRPGRFGQEGSLAAIGNRTILPLPSSQ
jgi:hypothetical protein